MSPELTKEGEAIVAALTKHVDERIADISKSVVQIDERCDQLSGLSSDVEEIAKKLEERAGGAAYVTGAEDHFSKDPEANPAKQFSMARATELYWNGWDIEKTQYANAKDKSLFPERDLCHEATQKAQSAGVDTEGGFAVPEQFNAQFIPSLLQTAVTPRLGARLISDFKGSPVVFPRVDQTASSSWTAENANTDESQATLGSVEMTPHALRSFIPMSNRLMRQSSIGFETFLMSEMRRYMSRDIDAGALVGTGAGSQPTGLKNLTPAPGVVDWATGSGGPGTTAAGWSGGDQVVTNKLAEYSLRLAEDNALFGRLGWIMSPATYFRFQSFPKDADGRPILQIGDPNQVPQNSFYGHPFGLTTVVAGGTDADLFFGNWEELVIGQWGTMVMRKTNEGKQALLADQSYLAAYIDVDFGFWHSESFANADNLDVTTDPS